MWGTRLIDAWDIAGEHRALDALRPIGETSIFGAVNHLSVAD